MPGKKGKPRNRDWDERTVAMVSASCHLLPIEDKQIAQALVCKFLKRHALAKLEWSLINFYKTAIRQEINKFKRDRLSQPEPLSSTGTRRKQE